MKSKNLKDLFGELEALHAQEEPAEEAPAASRATAAQRLGEAMLDLFGPIEGVDEDEFVDALIGEWTRSRRSGGEEARDEAVEAASLLEPESEREGVFPFSREARTPVPMRTAGIGSEPVDYSEMSAKQFSELRRLLKKAAADGKKIRL